MAFVAGDLATIDAAIASGLRKVVFADGRLTEYQNASEMLAARLVIKSEVALAANIAAGRPRRRFAQWGSGL